MNQNRTAMKKENSKLESYVRYFAYKSIQAIVQSRTCIKRRSRSKPNSGSYDWFNVAIEDEPSIQEQAEKAICSLSLISNFSLCVEIQLQTSDKDRLILETWCLSLGEPRDLNISVGSIYPSMCVLLKSIIAVSRVTPAYTLSGRQSHDSYTILYRIYFGAPQKLVLGEGYQENKIGEIRTPIGTLTMTLAFRTKMTITPQRMEKESPFMVKSDYFDPDLSPKRVHAPPMNGFHITGNYMARNHCQPAQVNGDAEPTSNKYEKYPLSFADSDHECNREKNNFLNGDYAEEYEVTGAFAPSTTFPDPSLFPELILPDQPVLNLPQCIIKSIQDETSIKSADSNANLNNCNVDNNKDNSVDFNCNANEDTMTKMSCSGNSDFNDFVMVDLKPPFADSDSGNELGAFFRECQCAPPLASFESQPTLEQQVTDITNQLAQFETSMHDFDTFVDAICQVDAKQ